MNVSLSNSGFIAKCWEVNKPVTTVYTTAMAVTVLVGVVLGFETLGRLFSGDREDKKAIAATRAIGNFSCAVALVSSLYLNNTIGQVITSQTLSFYSLGIGFSVIFGLNNFRIATT